MLCGHFSDWIEKIKKGPEWKPARFRYLQPECQTKVQWDTGAQNSKTGVAVHSPGVQRCYDSLPGSTHTHTALQIKVSSTETLKTWLDGVTVGKHLSSVSMAMGSNICCDKTVFFPHSKAARWHRKIWLSEMESHQRRLIGTLAAGPEWPGKKTKKKRKKKKKHTDLFWFWVAHRAPRISGCIMRQNLFWEPNSH